MQIRPFDPQAASERDLVDYHVLRSAAKDVDLPEDPPVTYAAAVGRLRNPAPAEGECRYWVSDVDEQLIGIAKITLPADANADNVMVEVLVHPEFRRRGIGTGLLRAALPTVLDTGRGIVVGAGIKPDQPGDLWTRRLGFSVTDRSVMQWLKVPSVPVALWDVEVPAGYRLTRWIGPTPDDLLGPYAAARPAIRDAPHGQNSYRETAWTAELIRATERELADGGVEERVVVAIETASGAVAGVTGILNYPHRREFGYQNDTSVLAAHRGHGLGRAMKAAMMRWIVEERPDIELIVTTTGAENTYMIDVNLAIGYETVRTMVWVETTTAKLADALAVLH
jgi:mycothiol synthase